MFDRLSEFLDDTKVEKPLYKISAYTFDCFGFSVICTLSPKMGKVGVWKASYYCNKTKTWIYGRLVIYTRCIRFVEEKEGRNCIDFRIYYEDFFELKKETTYIFYAAISVRVNTDKYWFSSFSDRGYVFNTIEHFWKERLFARCVEIIQPLLVHDTKYESIS